MKGNDPFISILKHFYKKINFFCYFQNINCCPLVFSCKEIAKAHWNKIAKQANYSWKQSSFKFLRLRFSMTFKFYSTTGQCYGAARDFVYSCYELCLLNGYISISF